MLLHRKVFLILIPILTVIVCPALLGPGIYFILKPTSRQEKIRQYNDAIEMWNNKYYSEFNNKIFSVNNQIGDGQSRTYTLTKNALKDTLNDSPRSGEDFLEYEAVKYEASSFLFFPDNTEFQSGVRPSRQVIFNSTAGEGSSLYSVSEPVFQEKAVEVDRDPDCSVADGAIDPSDGKCHFYYVVSSICAVVDTSSDGSIVTSNSNSRGCWTQTFYPNNADFLDKTKAVFSEGDAFRYHKLPPDNEGEPQPPSDDDQQGDFILRHVHDPFIVALEVTDGTLYFGDTDNSTLGLKIGLVAAGGTVALLGMVVELALCLKWVCQPKTTIGWNPNDQY